MSRYATLVLTAALGSATLALAQSPQPDSGFFPPKPGDDPSLTHTLPPDAYPPPPAPAAPLPAPTAAAPTPTPPTPMPQTTTTVTSSGPQVSANVENAMDRSEAEARNAAEATARAPHINGAFTGLTDERDR
jgi:2-oxoglutarate decarboxylase